jgi:hypothetical protein
LQHGAEQQSINSIICRFQDLAKVCPHCLQVRSLPYDVRHVRTTHSMSSNLLCLVTVHNRVEQNAPVR